ncbi:MAG TPA: hypothetical protein VHM48_00060 [Candidatus Limnocylindrales bacterium]|nr:hypothetical protein [Candidatus Limnocylindrales bacterium]
MPRFALPRPTALIASGGLALAMALGSIAAPVATLASGGSAVRAVGHCTGHSTSALKAKHDNGRIEVEFEVDQNRSNRLWYVRVTDDTHLVYRGSKRTVAPSGSFTVRLLIPNRAGTDTIAARAVNATTGEVCTARLNV